MLRCMILSTFWSGVLIVKSLGRADCRHLETLEPLKQAGGGEARWVEVWLLLRACVGLLNSYIWAGYCGGLVSNRSQQRVILLGAENGEVHVLVLIIVRSMAISLPIPARTQSAVTPKYFVRLVRSSLD